MLDLYIVVFFILYGIMCNLYVVGKKMVEREKVSSGYILLPFFAFVEKF
jgi:hypothetical protein